MDAIIERILGNDRAADHYGMETLEYADGHAAVGMEIGDRHLNGNGTVHGGVLFALADVAFALAANSRGTAVAAQAGISFCAAVRSGRLVATAREVSLGGRLGTYLVEIRDGEGKFVASFQGLAYRTTVPRPSSRTP